MTTLSDFVGADDERPLPGADKIAGTGLAGRTSASLSDAPVALSTLPTPMMTIDRSAVRRNITVMQQWCEGRGVLLAPHGKTTMSPALWHAQLAAGAWGITVANEAQLRLAIDCGVPRVHLANTLLSAEGLCWLVETRKEHPELLTQFWIDSTESVGVIERALRDVAVVSPIPVLLEVGVSGGRTGTRSRPHSLEVASAISESRHLRLVGVAGYEGAVPLESDRLDAVDQYLHALVTTHREISRFYADGDVFLTAGGSAYFDRAAAVLGDAACDDGPPVRILLRSGAYVAHDDGLYARITPSVRGSGPVFRAALHAWARVVSVPEPGMAILDAGRRDVPFDQGPPLPQQLRRRSQDDDLGSTTSLRASIAQLNDQHAFLEFAEPTDVRVGDVVRMGISHPCTAFDKWRTLPVIDDPDSDDPAVRALITTYF